MGHLPGILNPSTYRPLSSNAWLSVLEVSLLVSGRGNLSPFLKLGFLPCSSALPAPHPPQTGLSRGTQFPFDLFKAGPQCAAPIRADPFLLVTKACKMDQPHFSSLAFGALPGLCSVISLV